MKAMWIALTVLGVLVTLVIVVGYLLPRDHHVWRERVLAAPAATIHALIAQPASYPGWRRGVRRVEMLPDAGGKVRFREVSGSDAITFVFDESVPERRLVSRIVDANLPFGGTWTWEMRPEGAGTLVRITEDGQVKNPVFRFVSRFIMGQYHTIDTFLDDLERKVRESEAPPGSRRRAGGERQSNPSSPK